MFQQRPSTCAVWFNGRPVEYHTFRAGNESNRGKFERRKCKRGRIINLTEQMPKSRDGFSTVVWFALDLDNNRYHGSVDFIVGEVLKGNLYLTNPSALEKWRGWYVPKKKPFGFGGQRRR